MIGKKIEKALNEQINAELYSAYLYLSMVAYFESVNLTGFATWMRAQTQEEIMHAMKMYDFINERGGRVILKAIEMPPPEWGSALAAFEAAYAHEQIVTGLINDLVNLAVAEKDHATNSFLQWFVNEQVEEETSADNVVQNLKMAQDAPGALFMLDRELGQRVFTPPAAQGAL
ncbi:MAG: ferritin [Phycisphaerae bacterium]|nr:ferritin [Phycisphaerae bacterium]